MLGSTSQTKGDRWRNHAGAVLVLAIGFSASVAAEMTTRPAWGDQGNGHYRNPVLWMDYNNPCVLRAGDTYYLTSATHHYMGMPLLKSRDLVNWTHAGRIYSDLRELSTDFDFPGKAYSAGSQDAEIGIHGGTFYLYNWSTRYRGFMSTAPSMEGPWSPVKKLKETIGGDYEDPCPFWDEDGKGYLLLVGNPGPLKIFPLNSSFDEISGEGVTLISDILPKGPQILKRDGYYFILVARTGPHKAQFAYRSRSLFGPYESRLLFEGKAQGIQAAQGSFVQVSGDDWAFVHHEYDMDSIYGRRVYLQPAGWREGWPWIGSDPDGDGVGEPVALTEEFRKPALPSQLATTPEHSDDFSSTQLGDQWMWNHNPAHHHWSLTSKPGWLCLQATPLNQMGGFSQYPKHEVSFHDDHLLFARNTIVQRICGKVSTISTRLNTAGMRNQQRAGLCTLSGDYTWIGVTMDAGVKRVVFRQGSAKDGPSATVAGPVLDLPEIWLRLEYSNAKGSFFYSLDGHSYVPLGPKSYAYQSTWYEGTKVGLMSYTTAISPQEGGDAFFDYFHQEHDGLHRDARD